VKRGLIDHDGRSRSRPGREGHLPWPFAIAAMKADKSLKEIHALWKRDIEEFLARRSKYLIYK